MNAPTAIAGASTMSTVVKTFRGRRGARCRGGRRPGRVEDFNARMNRLDRLAPSGWLNAVLRKAAA